jgi:alcohol dehydrogenase (NADP+)
MALQTLNYLAGDSNGEIHLKKSQRAIGGVEVLIKVTHSGVCGTDVHDRDSGCGLGHEGVGIIQMIGYSVTAVKVGQRVGWGYVTFRIFVSFAISSSNNMSFVVGKSRYFLPRLSRS